MMDNSLDLLDLKVYNYTYSVPAVNNDTNVDKIDVAPFKLYMLDEARNTSKPAKPAKHTKKPIKVIIRNKKKRVNKVRGRKDKFGAHYPVQSIQKPCIIKIKNKRGHRHGHKKGSHKKYLLPMLIGLMTAKAILLPFILKLLGLLASKGLLLGIVSTIMASFLSLKKILEPSVKYEGKRSDVTKIEVIPVPVHHDHHDHHSYHEKSFNNPHDVDVVYEDINVHNPYHGHYGRFKK